MPVDLLPTGSRDLFQISDRSFSMLDKLTVIQLYAKEWKRCCKVRPCEAVGRECGRSVKRVLFGEVNNCTQEPGPISAIDSHIRQGT